MSTVVIKCSSGPCLGHGLTTRIVVILGSALVPTAPLRPGQGLVNGLLHGHDQPPQQPPQLWNAQRQDRPRLALNAAKLLCCWTGGKVFVNASTAMAPARMTGNSAKAYMARVMCRYQPVQLRTS